MITMEQLLKFERLSNDLGLVLKDLERHINSCDARQNALEGNERGANYADPRRIGDRYRGKISGSTFIITQGRDGNLAFYSVDQHKYHPISVITSGAYEFINNVFDI